MIRLTEPTADPEPATLRADLATATARLDDIAALVVHHEAHSGGLIPACQLRAALGMGPRPKKESP